MKRIPDRERAEHSANGVIVILINLFAYLRTRTLVKRRMLAAAGQREAFQPDAEVTAKEEFGIETAAPGVIAPKESIVLAKDPEIIGNFDFGAIALGPGESVRAPDAHVEFAIAIIFFTALWHDSLFHFFPGVCGCARKTGRGQCAN